MNFIINSIILTENTVFMPIIKMCCEMNAINISLKVN